MKRELVRLLVTVLVVDALFVAGYFLVRLDASSDPVKIGYTAAWTIVSLLVVLRALARIRSARAGGG